MVYRSSFRKITLHTIIVSLVLFAPMVGVLPYLPTVSAQPLPEVTIDYVNSTTIVPLAPEQDGLIRYDFIVAVDQRIYQETTVRIIFEAGDWETWVDPEELVFETSGQQNCSAFLTIPAGTSHAVSQEVTLSAVVTVEPGGLTYDLQPSTASIVVPQYYAFEMSTKTKHQTVTAGQTVKYLIEVRNLGNYADTFKFEIGNKDALAKQGLHVSLSNEKIEVLEASTGTIELSVRASQSTNTGTYKLLLKSHSFFAQTNEDLTVADELELTVRVNPWLGIDTIYLVPIIIIAVVAGIIFFVWYRQARNNR